MHPLYLIRAFGGLLYLAGAVIMTINVWRTINGDLRTEAPMSDAAFDPAKDRPVTKGPVLTPQLATPAE